MAALDGDARLVLAQFSEINTAGHLDGVQFSGDSYDETKPYSLAIDSKVALLQKAVDKIDDRSDVPTTLLVLSDHGHLDRGGAGGTSAAERDVPFLARRAGSWGAPLAGYELCPEETRMVDVAPTVAALLGLPVPRHSQGRLLLNLFVHNTTAVSAAGAERRLTAQQEQEERSVQDSVQEQQERAEAAEAAMSEYRRLSEGGSGDDIGGAGEDEGSGDAVASPPPPPHAAIITTEFTAAGDVGDYDDDKKGKIAEAFAAEAGVSVEAVSVTVVAASVKITVEVEVSDGAAAAAAATKLQTKLADKDAATTFLADADVTVEEIDSAPEVTSPSGHAPPPPPPPVVVVEEDEERLPPWHLGLWQDKDVYYQRRAFTQYFLTHPELNAADEFNAHANDADTAALIAANTSTSWRELTRLIDGIYDDGRDAAAANHALRNQTLSAFLLGVWMVLALLVMQLQTHCDPLALLSCRSPADTPALRFSFLCVVLYYLFCVGIFLAVGAGARNSGAILAQFCAILAQFWRNSGAILAQFF